MNFNIALNTIIYIMVFLFPGVLFRKFYFSGKFSKQFNQGNLLERFLWTLFCSIISLTACGYLFYVIENQLRLELLHNITFSNITNIFSCLATNQYPDEFYSPDYLIDLGILLVVIYTISILFGILCIRIVRALSFDLFLSTLRFNNDWLYLSEANKENGVTRKFGDIYITYVDILTLQKDKEELYRGIHKNFFFDKENKLENVVIANASKFIQLNKEPENEIKISALTKLINNDDKSYTIHKNYEDKIVFKKNIEGSVLVLSAQNIINLNFTYVKISNKLRFWKLKVIQVNQILAYIIFLALIIFPFIKVNVSYFDSFMERSIFSVSTLLVTIFVLIAINMILKFGTENFRKNVVDNFILAIMFSIPYLWVFDLVTWYYLLIIWIALGPIAGLLLTDSKNQKK